MFQGSLWVENENLQNERLCGFRFVTSQHQDQNLQNNY